MLKITAWNHTNEVREITSKRGICRLPRVFTGNTKSWTHYGNRLMLTKFIHSGHILPWCGIYAQRKKNTSRTLFQKMDSSLSGAKPLYKPMNRSCQSHPKEHISWSVKTKLHLTNFSDEIILIPSMTLPPICPYRDDLAARACFETYCHKSRALIIPAISVPRHKHGFNCTCLVPHVLVTAWACIINTDQHYSPTKYAYVYTIIDSCRQSKCPLCYATSKVIQFDIIFHSWRY